MKSILFSLFLFAPTTFCLALVVPTTEGPVLGQVQSQSLLFANIPYAKPPIGELRWKAPRPAQKRKKLWQGQTKNIICAQLGRLLSGVSIDDIGKPVGSEDCLYLNIWTPVKIQKTKRPVLVWFHGGSNKSGYASDPLYSGNKLSTATNSIVVTVNYRLGHLGAFYHEALDGENKLDASGNYVTLDGIQALTWLKNNIEFFGGDKNNITIAGESAGGINVWGLMQSPLAKGLFQKAYVMSGAPNAYPTVVAESRSNEFINKALASKGLAQDENSASLIRQNMSKDETLKFLYSLSSEDILRTPLNAIPVSHISDGTVLPITGLAGLSLGNFNQVPIMQGTTGLEASYFILGGYLQMSEKEFSALLLEQPEALEKLNNFMSSPMATTYLAQSWALTKQFEASLWQINNFIYLYTDIYQFQINWKAANEPWRTALGAAHGVDLPLMFMTEQLPSNHYLSFLNPSLKLDGTRKISRAFVNSLKSFLHKGAPDWKSWMPIAPNIESFGD